MDEYDEEDIKHGILEAALELVAIHGWTKSAIVAAAESYGYPGVAHGTLSLSVCLPAVLSLAGPWACPPRLVTVVLNET